MLKDNQTNTFFEAEEMYCSPKAITSIMPK
jgi:hypothetical protein